MLVAVVAFAIAGRVVSGTPRSDAAVAAAESPPAADWIAVASTVPVAPETPGPSLAWRSDWPAINPRAGGRRVDKPALLDDRAEWSKDAAGRDATAPWVHRLGAMSNYRTDPYER